MSQQEAFIHIPPTLDGLEEASEKVLSKEDDPRKQAAYSDIKDAVKKLKIIEEYFEELDKRPDEHYQIKRELAEKYENNPDRAGYIHYVIYDWKKKRDEEESNEEKPQIPS